MSRVINPDSAGKERTRLTKIIVISIRELWKQTTPNDLTRDLIACILLSLDRIYETIDITVEAWEKRDYWVKADRFRMDWEWTKFMADDIRPLVLSEKYQDLIPYTVKIAQKLDMVKVSENHRLGTPWVGCWSSLNQNK